jgi:undecaprenyl diphosphate synthase
MSLMRLLVSSLKKEIHTLKENNIKLNAIGNLDALPKKVLLELKDGIEETKVNTRMTLTLALSYGSRDELLNAVKEISSKVKNNIISEESIDESVVNAHLYTQNLPDVDLLIRTSGEQRISNFLLWQIAYAELCFIDVLWPDFSQEHLAKALIEYQNRERRFGKTSEQLS